MRNLYLTIALSLICAPLAAAPPRSVEIGYEIAKDGSVLAEVSQRLEHDGRTYRIESRRYFKAGQFAIDPNENRLTENLFESSARIEVYKSPAP